MSYYFSWLSSCISRGYHVVDGAGFGTAPSATVMANYCRDCGYVLAAKTLPTKEEVPSPTA